MIWSVQLEAWYMEEDQICGILWLHPTLLQTFTKGFLSIVEKLYLYSFTSLFTSLWLYCATLVTLFTLAILQIGVQLW